MPNKSNITKPQNKISKVTNEMVISFNKTNPTSTLKILEARFFSKGQKTNFLNASKINTSTAQWIKLENRR